MAGPLLSLDLSISQGADEPYGPWGLASSDSVDPFSNYPSMTYLNLTGYSAAWVVRTEDNDTSTAILSYTSGTSQITFLSLAAEEGPPVPAFVNAVQWSVPNVTSSDLAIGNYYHSLWLIDGTGKRTLFLKGLYAVVGAQ